MNVEKEEDSNKFLSQAALQLTYWSSQFDPVRAVQGAWLSISVYSSAATSCNAGE